MSRARRSGSQQRGDRMARVDEVILQVLAEELERCADPRVELVTLTGVRTARDLGSATVYYAVPVRADGTDADAEETAAGLRAVGRRLRGALGRQVRLRQTPELRFQEDQGVLQGRRIEEILRGIRTPAADDVPDADASDGAVGAADAGPS